MTLRFCALAILASVGVAAMAQSFTVATFSDPTIGQPSASSTMFSFNSATNQLSGNWTDLVDGNLVVNVGGTTYFNSSMTMAPVTATPVVAVPGFYTLDRGSITFTNISTPNYLTIQWTGGVFLTGAGFGANGPGVVTFSGSAVGSQAASWDQESFFFSFANSRTSQGITTYTSSLTSSAVPEPFTMAALALGAGLVAARRRRRS